MDSYDDRVTEPSHIHIRRPSLDAKTPTGGIPSAFWGKEGEEGKVYAACLRPQPPQNG